MACPKAGYNNLSAITSDGTKIRLKIFWVDCGTYKRTQSAKAYLTGSNGPATIYYLEFRDAFGNVRLRVENFEMVNTQTIDLLNRSMTDVATVTYAGEIDGLGFAAWGSLLPA